MALEFAKELLGDAYTGELEEKLEAKINELYAPKADLDAASARADGLQEQLDAANEAIGKFEGLDAEQVKAQIADYKQRAEAAEKDREGCLARAEYMLHSLTLDRLQNGAWQQDETLAKCVRMAHCALADAQHAQDTAVLAGGKVTSESVGNWSRSIQQDDERSGSFERRCLRIAAQYIPIRSGLLYRGVSGC